MSYIAESEMIYVSKKEIALFIGPYSNDAAANCMLLLSLFSFVDILLCVRLKKSRLYRNSTKSICIWW